MSTAGTWGSAPDTGNRDSQSDVKSEDNGQPIETSKPLDDYLRQPEPHEKTILGQGTSNNKKAVRKHKARAKAQMKKINTDLPK